MGIQSIDAEDDQFAYRYDTQLLIERRDRDLDEDEISDYITEHFEGNSLIAAGDEDLIKIHFHTNEPWKILEYCSSVGEIFDIVVEDMIRQSNGLQGQIEQIRECQKTLPFLIPCINFFPYSSIYTARVLSSSSTNSTSGKLAIYCLNWENP